MLNEQELILNEKTTKDVAKKVILINIDTLMSAPLEEAVQTGKAPALQYLMKHGQYFSQMVSSYPTMSVTIDSSLLTGTYADKHQIPGLSWFDITENEFINYGTGLREAYKLGASKVITNMLYRLNNQDLNKDTETIFEALSKKGLKSASINSFVYRGNTPHFLHLPKLVRAFTGIDEKDWKTKAPFLFSLGSLSKFQRWSVVPQMFASTYKHTARELRYLIKKKLLPSFTICMFQDLDIRIHFKGPRDKKGISRIDQELQKVLNLFPSWDAALRDNIWIVIGDNGHSPTGSSYKKYIIDVRKLLSRYRIARIKRGVKKTDQIAICVNQRMAYIHLLYPTLTYMAVASQLQRDERINIIAWKNNDEVIVVSGNRDGELRYKPEGKYVDQYNQSWTIQGELDLLHLRKNKDNNIEYGDFPDALARLYGAVNSHQGRYIVINAIPGCDFKAESTPFHLAGAAHGSLHRQETYVPLIIAGTKKEPKYTRIVDLKDFILDIL